MQWMARSGRTFRFSLSEGEERATGEERRDINYQAITAGRYSRPTAIALFLRTQFRNVSEAQLDIRSTAVASDKGFSVPSTHEPDNEQGGLP
jgi:hypothetical protein